MKVLCLSLLFLCSIAVCAQENIEVLYQNEDYIPIKESRVLEFIDANMDVSSEIKIAEYRLIMNKHGKKNLSKTYMDFNEMAVKTGANSFTIEDVKFEDFRYIVTVSLYDLSEDQMQENFSYYEDNIVVVFGDLNTKNPEKTKGCKINGKKVEILPYTYVKNRNEIGGKTKVSVGGMLGSSVSITGEPDKLARCLSLGGVSVLPSGGMGFGSAGSGGGVGVSISTGQIYPMDTAFGLFLMTILDNAEIQ